ncbi:glucose PTS transporter subunit IIA [Sporolactobacillus sp. THM19-2]|uniref:glucose PTS transporter subunit IIA n=1 Tax=Sporolactobacillus sp. THM19-2 TaxID=2511171 RepID=UPI001021C1B3|nr:glucose PTS transporter subunit IIA [Sporolactobacillus sp. THM19-2]RYL93967.1 PTS beta-glucoside transporter subunit IIBCA [Sporolactobacillus sp. THM19-2]
MAGKKERYEKISDDILKNIGGKENAISAIHCATRLRITVKDKRKINLKQIEEVDLAKGAFINGNQLQIIFGAGLVDAITAVFTEHTGIPGNTDKEGDAHSQAGLKQNAFQRFLKSLTDVFIEIMPGILAAGILTGLTSILGQKGLFGPRSVVEMVPSLAGINRIINIGASGIFAMLPLLVVYSATKRYGGRAVLGLAMGTVMMSASLPDAFAVGSGAAKAEIVHIFGLPVQLIGFQGGIIVALLMGYAVAKLDQFFTKKLPGVIQFVLAPMLTILVSSLLLFIIIGPVGQLLASGITNSLVWMANTLGIFGYMIFAGIQQIIVITGLHNMFGAVEAQLLSSTGHDFLNPLMSVALAGQGGAVIGYMILKWKHAKTRELCISAFTSVLFGISEPAIFGVNLKYKFPLLAGCIGGALAGGYVYLTRLTALSFGTTALPGIAIAEPANNGYLNYIIANLIGIAGGIIFTLLLGAFHRETVTEKGPVVSDKSLTESIAPVERRDDVLSPVASGKSIALSDVNDKVFSSGSLGKGAAIVPNKGEVVAPADGQILTVFVTGHAIGFRTDSGAELLIHIGIDTVKLKGKFFDVRVNQGQKVNRGDLLVNFDLEELKKLGYDTTISVVVTNSNDFHEIDRIENETVIDRNSKFLAITA